MKYVVRTIYGNSSTELEEHINELVRGLNGRLINFSALPANVDLANTVDNLIPFGGIMFMAVIEVDE